MLEEKQIIINSYIDEAFNPKRKDIFETEELITYKLLLNNCTATISFQTDIFTNIQLDNLSKYLNKLDLLNLLNESKDNILLITEL